MRNENILQVSETFYSIQGEGPNSGVPSYFLRLTGCNLDCIWCDTTEVWKKGTLYSFDDLIMDMVQKKVLKGLLTGMVNLVITGGEPLLQIKRIVNFLDHMSNRFGNYPLNVEIETNGTIHPGILEIYVNSWIVSPKLRNSGEPEEKRFNFESLKHFSSINKNIGEDVNWKFVIVIEDDLMEVLNIIKEYDIPPKNVWLMPEGTTAEVLQERSVGIINICKEFGFRFSSRLQVSVYGQLTGI